MPARVSGEETHLRDIWKEDRGKKEKDETEASEKKPMLEDTFFLKKVKS